MPKIPFLGDFELPKRVFGSCLGPSLGTLGGDVGGKNLRKVRRNPCPERVLGHFDRGTCFASNLVPKLLIGLALGHICGTFCGLYSLTSSLFWPRIYRFLNALTE